MTSFNNNNNFSFYLINYLFILTHVCDLNSYKKTYLSNANVEQGFMCVFVCSLYESIIQKFYRITEVYSDGKVEKCGIITKHCSRSKFCSLDKVDSVCVSSVFFKEFYRMFISCYFFQFFRIYFCWFIERSVQRRSHCRIDQVKTTFLN